MASEAVVVEALYTFKGSNNDELCFKKGDLIAVTQKDEGWWEGTLNGKTGWFPCNYVKETKDSPKIIIPQENQYKSVVLKDLIDSERAHIAELEGLVTNFLQPLEKSSILSSDEYKQLTGNIVEVLETRQQLLKLIEIEDNKPTLNQRVGKLFIDWAPRVQKVHQTYCSLHPRAVCILDKYKDELTTYMESRGAASPGVLVLTILLSKPFRRLEKYPGMLQELERHIEECHPDRGDTQRCVAVYKEIAAACSATRRQKELELQVLTGPVKGWEGPSLATLGEVICMASVAVGPQHADRYYVLFPNTLLILSVSFRLSSFIYEGKLPLSGMQVKALKDNEQYKNAFEISTAMTEPQVAVCQSRAEASHWVELLKKQIGRGAGGGGSAHFQPKVAPSQAQYVPQQPTNTPQVVAATTPSVPINSSTPKIPPHGFSSTSLRPLPSLRPCLSLDKIPYSRPIYKYSSKTDAAILDVIEAYISSTVKPRNTANSVDVTSWMKTNTNKDLSDTVQVLQSQLNVLDHKVMTLSSELCEEKAMRCALQSIVQNLFTNNCKDFDKIEWPTMESNI